MTIIQPTNNKIRFHWITISIIGLVLVEVILAIMAYSKSVDLKYALDRRLSLSLELRAKNADLENLLYAKINNRSADQLAAELGLIREKKPDYLTSTQR